MAFLGDFALVALVGWRSTWQAGSSSCSGRLRHNTSKRHAPATDLPAAPRTSECTWIGSLAFLAVDAAGRHDLVRPTAKGCLCLPVARKCKAVRRPAAVATGLARRRGRRQLGRTWNESSCGRLFYRKEKEGQARLLWPVAPPTFPPSRIPRTQSGGFSYPSAFPFVLPTIRRYPAAYAAGSFLPSSPRSGLSPQTPRSTSGMTIEPSACW